MTIILLIILKHYTFEEEGLARDWVCASNPGENMMMLQAEINE